MTDVDCGGERASLQEWVVYLIEAFSFFFYKSLPSNLLVDPPYDL